MGPMKKYHTILGEEALVGGCVADPFKMQNCGRKRRVTVVIAVI